MRRQLFFVLVLVLAGVEGATACSFAPGYGPPSDEELFAKASSVFVGRVFRVEKSGVVATREWLALPPWMRAVSLPSKAEVDSMPSIPAIEATFRVVEVFKGKPPADSKIRAPIYMHCVGPMLLAGTDHLFFLYEGNFVRSWLEARPAGLTPEQEAERSRLLEKLRELSKSEREQSR